MAQIVLAGPHTDATLLFNRTSDIIPNICWDDPWDGRLAAFTPCFLPVVAAVPGVVATLVAIVWALGSCITWRPAWTLPFVPERPHPDLDDLVLEAISRPSLYALLLDVVASIGGVLQVAATILGWPDFGHLVQLVPWAVTLAMLAVRRPRTTPFSLLFLQCIYIICQSIVLASDFSDSRTRQGLDSTLLALSAIAVIILLLMPLRDPSLPSHNISKPFTDATSSLRSPEDDMSLWQFMSVSWMTPLINTGSRRQLEDADVWQLGFEFQHRRLHDRFRRLKGTVMQRLLQANGIDLVIITLLGIFETIAGFGEPVLLQKLLSAMQHDTASHRAALTYATITFAVQLLKTQSGVFSLWFGRRCYERSRGEMITMLYEKTLARKIGFVNPDTKPEVNGSVSHGPVEGVDGQIQKPSRWSWFTCLGRFKRTPTKTDVKEAASMGKILNLMRNDVYEVAQRFWEFQSLITKPLSVIFSLTLVVNFLGWSSLLAVAVMLTAQIINAVLVRVLVKFETSRRKATDGKLHIVSQFIEAIRHLRWYGWQDAWLEKIMTARQRELNWRVITSLWGLLIGFVNSLALDLAPPIGFYAYTVIGKQPLTVDIAFPALYLFNMLTMSLRDLPGLITVLLNAWVAVGRIEDFMAEPDRDDNPTDAMAGDDLAVEHASFAWPGRKTPVLQDLSLTFAQGLTVVCGEVASGKSALLQALLGELDTLEGRSLRPRVPFGYCSQTPWLQSMSIRDNILFSAPYAKTRYDAVIEACALIPDLKEFKAGDQSFIGENGIGLSGGQRARVALARAVYSSAGILLLDDPLSALDQQTAEAIVRDLFTGPLLDGRTVVLVTHRLDLVADHAVQLIEITAGKAVVLDTEEPPVEVLQREISAISNDEVKKEDTTTRKAAVVPDNFIEEEYRAKGGVRASVYWSYIKAGNLRLWVLLVIVLVVYRSLSVWSAWLLKSWGERYNTKSSMLEALFMQADTSARTSELFDNFPDPEVNVRPWILTFGLIGLSRTLLWSFSNCIMVLIVYTAGKRMFKDIMVSVSHATFRFYDVTPIGRLMNRMTSDIGVIDGNISQQFQNVSWQAISWVTAVVVIAATTPSFLVFSVAVTIVFVLIFRRFLPTSQSLRRLEMVSLTPLMSNFGELLNGLITVRAFDAQERFQDRVIRVVDTFQKMDHFYWSLQSWLMYRYDALSALSKYTLTLLALLTGVSPGLTAFVLNSAQKFVVSTHSLCRQYGQLQMEFVSVERVVELLHLAQEPAGTISPPAWWPSFTGDIVFEKVTIRYAPHLDPALSNISFTIPGGSKCAIIGRTGSGKSTLALALLATILPSEGSISIDNIDLATVDKQLLRTRITFLAQDPVLFPGTMRQNLDPLEAHTDDSCLAVLSRVCARQGWSLNTPIDGGGSNLSQGQRQLVGLARAVLRRSAVIILDEATASIDFDTAQQIQQVLHEEMRESTVITIAHRLEAVQNADWCVVLGKGRVVEQGPAGDMMGRGGRGVIEEEVEEGNDEED
ncbi:hypothetical protein B0A48_01187 [Cryoendolithus antarcticus]|uniref:ABC transporter n=1 Tax=Cryoendolithus antarcticus TaxID=1507870 RepID=A0A1V8TSP6_9PEZI|nr:hypothetical protein B0A48_01187 [Cryoendolithus antarcticus]